VFKAFEPEYELVNLPVRVMGTGNDGTYYAFGPSKPPFRLDPDSQLLALRIFEMVAAHPKTDSQSRPLLVDSNAAGEFFITRCGGVRTTIKRVQHLTWVQTLA
jgi:hypothetical protein